MKTKQRSMTEGTIWKEIILFSIPLLIGNLFQQLYNTVDSVVVGNYVGESALAAVGASSPLGNLIIGLFMGISAGAGILVSRYFGARKDKDLSETVHTFYLMSLIMGLVLTVVGFILSPLLLNLLGTPESVMHEAVIYLKIYFAGILGLVIYNTGSGILRAVGDSRRPLIYLIVSSLINVVLDLVFVLSFGMGIEGVAYATLIAQGTSAILVSIHLFKTQDVYGMKWSSMTMHAGKLKEIIRLGIPTGIQQMVVSFSNVLVQGYMNGFGGFAVAGFTAANKFNSILSLPTDTFSLTITTFTGQNLGARQKDRVQQGLSFVMRFTIITLIIMGIPTYIAAPHLIALFSSNPEVIDYGVRMLHIMIPFYPVLAVTMLLSGVLRGSGLTIAPMVIMVFSYTIARQIFLFFAMKISVNVDWVFWSYSVTWALSTMLTYWYHKKSNWLETA